MSENILTAPMPMFHIPVLTGGGERFRVAKVTSPFMRIKEDGACGTFQEG